MLVDKTGLLYRVLVARYGDEAGRVSVGGGEFLRGGGRLHGFGMVRVMRGRGGRQWSRDFFPVEPVARWCSFECE
ncbi:hypothetical protein A2U01_0069962, partial [Trifolium medium]|nr:hypothetical protein [Trifolium medium]